MKKKNWQDVTIKYPAAAAGLSARIHINAEMQNEEIQKRHTAKKVNKTAELASIAMQRIKKLLTSHLIQEVSMYKDYIFAAVKLILGIFTTGFFYISAIYSICIGLCKREYVKEIKDKGRNNEKDCLTYRKMAFFILSGSIVYVLYMARLFFYPGTFALSMIPAITVATVSFTELFFAVKGMIKAQGILQKGLRCVSLTSSFTAIVLTQVAILSFANTGDSSFYNAVSGCAFGGLCILTGLVMLINYMGYKRNCEIKTAENKLR